MKQKFRIKELARLSNLCRKIMEVGTDKSPSTFRAYEAMRIFEKITLHSISFIKLWPINNEDESLMELDAATLASIARIIIETHNVFHYLTENGISKNEFEFRKYLSSLHQAKKTREILNKFQFPESDGITQVFIMSERTSTRMLKENLLFQSLNQKEQIELLKGKKAYYLERIKNKKFPLEPNIESGVYNFLSNSVHSFPIGLMNCSLGASDNHLDWINLVYLSLETSLLYVASVTSIYLKIRRALFSSISVEDKRFVNEMINNENIADWIQFRQIEGQKLIFSTNFS